jgi:hypothetical protein
MDARGMASCETEQSSMLAVIGEPACCCRQLFSIFRLDDNPTPDFLNDFCSLAAGGQQDWSPDGHCVIQLRRDEICECRVCSKRDEQRIARLHERRDLIDRHAGPNLDVMEAQVISFAAQGFRERPVAQQSEYEVVTQDFRCLEDDAQPLGDSEVAGITNYEPWLRLARLIRKFHEGVESAVGQMLTHLAFCHAIDVLAERHGRSGDTSRVAVELALSALQDADDPAV